MARDIHLERQSDSVANIHANLDKLQLAMAEDGNKTIVMADENGTRFYHAAMQKYWTGAAYVFQDSEFNDVEAHGDVLVSADIKRALGTDDKITFNNDQIKIVAGGVDALVAEDDRVYTDLNVGLGIDTPLAKLHIDGGNAYIMNATVSQILVGHGTAATEYSYLKWTEATSLLQLGLQEAGDVFTIDANGSAGIKTTPSADWDVDSVIQMDEATIGFDGSLYGENSEFNIGFNTYYDGTDNRRFSGNPAHLITGNGSALNLKMAATGAPAGIQTFYSNLYSYTGGVIINSDQQADRDFIVHGDTNTNMFFCDVSTEKVGIGKIPTEKLSIDLATDDLDIVDANASSGSMPLTFDGFITVKIGGTSMRILCEIPPA